jgi:Helicase HerA, central domain
MPEYEKLGAFYLGKEYDLAAGKRKENLILYDSKDLTTHAMCVGMTGSGKTGLCLTLLEEAAIDGIPAVVIDPKGDLGNLLLQFPSLSKQEFLPWINEEEARKKGVDAETYASQQADLWRKGLAEWQQDGARIQRLKDSADFSIYTPGSNAGLSVSVLKSFNVPPKAVIEDSELFREKVVTTATALLGLLGIEANPLQSREHILISTILENAWKQGQNLDLGALIQSIQNPPFAKVGVMDLESFYPSKDRFTLATTINNLLAAPGFSAWMEGEELDFGRFLHTDEGKPRISIFTISHLSDSERMFFVTLLLTQGLGWMRTQPGTTSLRAILYMDEIFGYFPPIANPPSKQPLLTLLKQARAFGLGVVLATQNPVDLDYKGLANAGTWFLGRLQTERDKERVLEGLEGASTIQGIPFNRQKVSETLAALRTRVFLMNNVHEESQSLFETRWCLSYLRGPLTRDDTKRLMAQKKTKTQAAAPVAAQEVPQSKSASSQRPVVPPEVPQNFLPIRGVLPADGSIHYTPNFYGAAKTYYADGKIGISAEQEIIQMVPINENTSVIDWQTGTASSISDTDLDRFPAEDSTWGELPAGLVTARNYQKWSKDFGDWIFRTQKLDLMRSPSSGQVSRGGETERDFRIRLSQSLREKRDAEVEKLRRAYAPKIQAIEERIRKAEQAVQREQEQAKNAGYQTAISVGTTILGALFGRKKISVGTLGRASTAARGVSRSMKESKDIDRAQETAGSLKQRLTDLENELNNQIEQLNLKLDPQNEVFETFELRPKKTNISVRLVSLVWEPKPRRNGE